MPAVFAITTDPYIVYTSNIFAILGLRALYFALAAVLHRFHYLKYALAILLVFIGSKIFVADLMGWEKFPAMWSLGDHLRDSRPRAFSTRSGARAAEPAIVDSQKPAE